MTQQLHEREKINIAYQNKAFITQATSHVSTLVRDWFWKVKNETGTKITKLLYKVIMLISL